MPCKQAVFVDAFGPDTQPGLLFLKQSPYQAFLDTCSASSLASFMTTDLAAFDLPLGLCRRYGAFA